MAKRNVSYVKPQEPEFLTKLKAQVGYKEKDTIETKKQVLPLENDSDDEKVEEQPVVVVLNSGDITAEEAEKIKIQQKEKEESSRANLEERIVFRAPSKVTVDAGLKRDRGKEDISPKKNKVKRIKNTKLLSFNEDEEDNDDS